MNHFSLKRRPSSASSIKSATKNPDNSNKSNSSSKSSAYSHHNARPSPIVPGDVFQLQIENNQLRQRLKTIESVESKSELLDLLSEKNSENAALLNKLQTINQGFQQIEKERKALRRSADLANKDRMEMEGKCKQIERHLKVRDREVETLAERCRDQERRIQSLGGENGEQKKKLAKQQENLAEMEGLKKQLEEVVNVKTGLEEEGAKMKQLWQEALNEVDKRNKDLEDLRLAEENIENELKSTRRLMEENLQERRLESQKWREKETQLEDAIRRRDDDASSLVEKLKAAKLESEKIALQMKEALAEREAAAENRINDIVQKHQREKSNLIDTMQSEIDAKNSAVLSLEKGFHELRSNIEKMKSDHATTIESLQEEITEWNEKSNALSDQYTSEVHRATHLNEELQHERLSHDATRTKLTSTIERIKAENEVMMNDIEASRRKLLSSRNELEQAQEKNIYLENQSQVLHEEKHLLEDECTALQNQLKMMDADYEDQLSQKCKRLGVLESELNNERSTTSQLRSQLRDVNLQFKEDAATKQQELRRLEQEVSELGVKLHDVEMNGADVVSDLEDKIAALTQEVANGKVSHERELSTVRQSLSVAKDEKERLSKLVNDQEKKIDQYGAEIRSLQAKDCQNGEEIKKLEELLSRAKRSTKESEDAVDAISKELTSTRSHLDYKVHELQQVIDDLRRQHSQDKEELAQANSILNERTNLLREMVSQCNVNQKDLDSERSKANQLGETVARYQQELKQSNEKVSQLEQEINDKEREFFEAVQNAHHQRKSAESRYESSRVSMEDALRRANEIEKENNTLKDKIQRQENYIGRLQDREKQERDRRRGPLATSKLTNRHSIGGKDLFGGGSWKANTHNVNEPRSPTRSPKRKGCKRYASVSAMQSNSRPGRNFGNEDKENDIRRLPMPTKFKAPRSPDELDELLG